MISPSRSILLLATRHYPRAWRARYGEEFAALIEDLPEGRARWATVGDTLRGAVWTRVRSGVTAFALFGGLAGLAVPERYVTGAEARVEQGVPKTSLTAAIARSMDRDRLQDLIAKYGL